jgi:hypothetical protein
MAVEEPIIVFVGIVEEELEGAGNSCRLGPLNRARRPSKRGMKQNFILCLISREPELTVSLGGNRTFIFLHRSTPILNIGHDFPIGHAWLVFSS